MQNTNIYFQAGNTISFEYDGKERHVKIEKVKMAYNIFFGEVPKNITGWDYNADHPVGGYRTFSVNKMRGVAKVV